MKKPQWLEKENLYKIMFESENPAGRIFDLTLITAISLSILISFVETIPSLAHTFKLVLEILEYMLTFFFTVEYIARVYCSPRPRDYVLSFFGVIDLLSTLPPYLSFFLPNARYMILLRSFRFIRIFRIFKLFSFINEGYLLSLFPVCADTGDLPGNPDVHGGERTAGYAIHRLGHIGLLGHRHDDNGGLWRHHACDADRSPALGLCHAVYGAVSVLAFFRSSSFVGYGESYHDSSFNTHRRGRYRRHYPE